MSTTMQQYSIENQKAEIRNYAARHGFHVIQTYTDAAKSGVSIKNRRGLSSLLGDVVRGACRYKAILVYDITRWGRFQDTDEAAHYEFVCRHAGVPVHYCAEKFANDASVSTSIIKTLKRTMAGEFSRELGIKVFEAKKRAAKLGFWMGGRAPYGLRRLMISRGTKTGDILKVGDRKNARSDRIVLTKGPPEEVLLVRHIFGLAQRGLGCSQILDDLNSRNVNHQGRTWIRNTVRSILTNPVYAGCNTWNRTSQRLHGPTVHLAGTQWIQKYGAFPQIVSRPVFERVQRLLQKRWSERRWSDEELVTKARWLLAKKGRITVKLLDETPGMPSSSTIRDHFGSQRRFYKLVGYSPKSGTFDKADTAKRTNQIRMHLVDDLVTMFPHSLTASRGPTGRPILHLDDGCTVSVLVCKTVLTPKGNLRWYLIPFRNERENVTLVCRLNAQNTAFDSLFLFPRIDIQTYHRLKENDSWWDGGEQLNDLSSFCAILNAVRYAGRSPANRSRELAPESALSAGRCNRRGGALPAYFR